MKKKLVLVVAVMLIAVTACVLFAGCVPNRPDKFMGSWIKSTHKAISIGYDDYTMETGIDGSKIIVKMDDKNQTIFEEKGDKLNVYVCVAGTWTAESIDIKDAGEEYKDAKKSMTEIDENEYKAITEAFEENYEKDDEGWWTGKSIALKGVSYKVDGNTLVTKMVGVESPVKMILNYKITIPSEAKKALNK